MHISLFVLVNQLTCVIYFASLCSRLNESMISLLSEVETYRQTQEVSDEVLRLLNNQEMISSTTAQCVSNETYQAVNRSVMAQLRKRTLQEKVFVLISVKTSRLNMLVTSFWGKNQI